jgi:hypothetical protein
MGARAAPVSIELIAGGACAKAASDGLAGGFEKALFLTFRIVGIGSQLENAQAKFLCRFLMSSVSGAVATDVLWSVNAAVRYFCQIARSSAVIVNQPNLNMYLPGSVTRPTCAQVILLTGDLAAGSGPVASASFGSLSVISSSPSSRDRT